ncbi:hypothetical protein HIM_08867 [Hirsutella minnesotensis 3608]|uniref:Endoplasmic reticulum membrane protein 65 n=1 Tax=Hirsutella minnesotensis 3608 TaxID=1043627 RepID=A0A0F7ZM58_9HYPO|nr:hypothetical protein HIM_08867 [Hirsutella minnesotensis 3608]
MAASADPLSHWPSTSTDATSSSISNPNTSSPKPDAKPVAKSLSIPAPNPNGGGPASAPARPVNGAAMIDERLTPRSAALCDDGLSATRGRSRSPVPPSSLGELSRDSQTIVKRGGSSSSSAAARKRLSSDAVQRLSAAEMRQLTSNPDSLPIAPAPQRHLPDQDPSVKSAEQLHVIRQRLLQPSQEGPENRIDQRTGPLAISESTNRALYALRTVSTPPTPRVSAVDGFHNSSSLRRYSFGPAALRPSPLDLSGMESAASYFHTRANSPAIHTGLAAVNTQQHQQQHQQQQQHSQQPPPPPSPSIGSRLPSPAPNLIPLPPMSLPTHLQLELAAQRPSPLYIHPSHSSEMPYESNAIKLERLKNVLLLAPYLERTLYFGALACLDAWLHTFTILPIRFMLALTVLARWWVYIVVKEAKWLVGFVWYGIGRLWSRARGGDASRRQSEDTQRERSRSRQRASEPLVEAVSTPTFRPRGRQQRGLTESHPDGVDDERAKSFRSATARDPGPKTGTFRHRRTKSLPSSLSPFHKADLLQGAVIICSSMALMTLDASRMYHFVRAQSAIKLYVIFNILEVGDRLLSALGQDILECLFSTETLSRNASGRSKIILPLTMFVLALIYNCLHSIALYYQVITLNVAVNSYSNALLTLLLSNQFVEIKSTVFKRFERDSLFQLTCADIVERFQLWVMLLIIGMRNVVEVGGLSVPGAGADSPYEDGGAAPMHPPSILPHSFTVLPSWLMSGEVLSPFLIVVGSEMLVDTIKHAYVTKFNNIKPGFYSRTLDILCKDYYSNAFTAPALTRRLGLAVIPLSCLFIRASVQTYHMFLSTKIPMPLPPSTQTSLAEESATPSSPAVVAALSRFDALIRDSLGRATYGYPYGSPLNSRPWYSWTSDDLIAALTMVVFFFMAFLILLIVKLLLGMALLKYARNRYSKMKHKERLTALGQAEREVYETTGRRVGTRPEVELGEERQRWINIDRNEGLPSKRPAGGAPDDKKGAKTKKHQADDEYQGVFRYEMVSKRIW